MARGRDGAGNDPLAFPIALHLAAELFDDADGFVPDGQALGDGILALQDMDVRAADCGGGYAHQRIQRPDIRYRLFVQDDPSVFDKDRRLHPACHGPRSQPDSTSAIMGRCRGMGKPTYRRAMISLPEMTIRIPMPPGLRRTRKRGRRPLW